MHRETGRIGVTGKQRHHKIEQRAFVEKKQCLSTAKNEYSPMNIWI